MDSIQALKGVSPHSAGEEHLSIYINGIRLDEMLARQEDETFLGLVPAWLDWYDDDFAPSRMEKEYVLRRMIPTDTATQTPVLLCPDDFDFSCTAIVAEVVCVDDHVFWKRMGIDVTPYDAEETVWPKYIGRNVRWFTHCNGFVFDKEEYLACVSCFAEGL